MNKKPPVSHWFNDDLFSETLLKVFLLVIGVSCLILMSLNILAEHYDIAFFETLLFILTASLWFLPRRWHYYQWVVLLYFGCGRLLAFIFR